MSGNEVVPTSTTLQARLRIFQASQRPRLIKSALIETSHGKSTIKGRLGQRHADLLELMLYHAERKRDIDDGGIELLVDPAIVRKGMSEKGKQYSYAQIEKLIEDLRMATITIETENLDFPIIGGLLDHVIPSPMKRKNPLTGGERSLWRVRLGIALVMLFQKDISLYYEPAPIAMLQHGISQAVARYVLSHKITPRGGWHLDTLLKTVLGNNIQGQPLRDARRRFKEDTEKLRYLGIEIDSKNKVKRVKEE